MDDKSTPIESLNNIKDSPDVVNQVLSKYNGLQDGTLPPLNSNLNQMEQNFENRNLNNEIYNLNSENVQYGDHYKNELNKTNQYNQKIKQNYEDEYDEDEYEEEYEIIEQPLWRRILNEIRIPVFIFIFIILINNCYFDKFLVSKIPFLGNQFNDCNTYGFFFKAFLASIISYLFIRFIRI
jgi:hypothetical protein